MAMLNIVMTKRIIAHLDMDAFFAAIEERDHPDLKGLPIAVGSDPKDGLGRGVVSTANYKAREYGIHSALPISRAWKISELMKKSGKPAVIFFDTNFIKYSKASQNIFQIIKNRIPLVEEASIDEAYLDMSFAGSFDEAEKAIKEIKNEIKEKEKLTASVGLASNKLLAKIASDMKKPDGLTIVREEDSEKFLEPLPIRKIPGIGPKTEAEFLKQGIRLVKDLKKFSRHELQELMGKWGGELYDKVRGIDDSPVTEEYEIKSIGEQETFEKDTLDKQYLIERMEFLCRGVFKRFKESDFKSFKTVAITVRSYDFTTKTRAHTLTKPTDDFKSLLFEALRLLVPFMESKENPRKKLFRLIGVRIEKLL